jgi:hypothetical protein
VEARSLGGFLVRVAAWLVVAFAVWWIATPLLAWPVALLSHAVVRIGFGDLVQGVDQAGQHINFITSLRPPAGGAKAVLEVPSDYRLFSFGLPLMAALTLAAGESGWPRRLAIGYAALLPVQTFSVVADFLKNLLSEPAVASQLGFAPWQRELVVFCYQFGTLILPAVAPAIVWVLLHRRFLERFAGRVPA